jgi:hypothetical protein
LHGTSFLVQHSANILAGQQCGESPDGRFAMRVVHLFVPAQDAQLAQDLQLARSERGRSAVAEPFHMSRAAARQVRAAQHPDHGLPPRLPGI